VFLAVGSRPESQVRSPACDSILVWRYGGYKLEAGTGVWQSQEWSQTKTPPNLLVIVARPGYARRKKHVLQVETTVLPEGRTQLLAR